MAQNNRKEPVRFDSVRLQTFRTIIGSVGFGSAIHFSSSMRVGLLFRTVRIVARSGSVRFGSVRFRVRFRLVPKLINRFGSVRFGQFGSVSYSFLKQASICSRRIKAHGHGPQREGAVRVRPERCDGAGGRRPIASQPGSRASQAGRQGSQARQPARYGVRPIFVLRFWISEGLTQA